MLFKVLYMLLGYDLRLASGLLGRQFRLDKSGSQVHKFLLYVFLKRLNVITKVLRRHHKLVVHVSARDLDICGRIDLRDNFWYVGQLCKAPVLPYLSGERVQERLEFLL